MKKGKIIGATVALMVTATVAQAFEFKGAQVNLEYRDAQNGQSQLQLEASGALSFGSGFGAQAGIKNADYDTAGDGAFGFEAHLTYDLGTDVVLGPLRGKKPFPAHFSMSASKHPMASTLLAWRHPGPNIPAVVLTQAS
jgi:hypothetical protein